VSIHNASRIIDDNSGKLTNQSVTFRFNVVGKNDTGNFLTPEILSIFVTRPNRAFDAFSHNNDRFNDCK